MIINQSIAIFDLVGTLITSKNGAPFTRTSEFILLGEDVIFKTMEDLYKSNYLILIICKDIPFNISKKVEKYFNDNLSFAIIFLRVKNDVQSTIRSINNLLKDIEINFDYETSFYCGDSIGQKDKYPPYQEDYMDSVIARRLHIPLIRPIDLFGNYEIKSIRKQEMLLMVGTPGAGKSTQGAKILHKNSRYVACDTDAMPDFNRKLTLECVDFNLKNNKSVIVLALNQTKAKRNDFIEIARKYGVYVRIAWFVRDGRPFNRFRHKNRSLPSTYYHSKPVKESIYISYEKQFEEPTIEECDELLIVY
jgi:hypothetical protein